MKLPIPKFYDQAMDALAAILFPSRKYVWVTLLAYTILLAGAFVWYFDNWLWVVAVGASMAMAWLALELLL
jgi:hypothetical protein